MNIPQSWLDAALNPPRAFGVPLGSGRLRTEPEDFVVEEDLGFAPAGAGPHALMKVRKRGANTDWVAREIARAAGCRSPDVGYAGLKDRHAVTVQWFSSPLPRAALKTKAVVPGEVVGASAVAAALAELAAIRGEGFEVLEAHAHTKKLPRGALAGNRFEIRVRDLAAADAAVEERMTAIAHDGVPNYFGPQRFGREASNLRRITSDPNAIHPRDRTYVLSAARSLVFNAVLAERVSDGTWNRLETGDVANLDAKGSVFNVEALDDTLTDRCSRLDIHPTGPLWGRDELLSRGRVQELETRAAAPFAEPCALTIAAGMNQERRSLRLAVRDLKWRREGDGLIVGFWLTKGSFATTVLREILQSDEAGSSEEG